MSDRQRYLKQYILACIQDSALSWSDLLANPDKFLKVLSGDIKNVLKELGREGSVNLLRVGAAMLAGFAENVVVGKRK